MLTQFSLEFFEENNLLHLHTINQIRWHVFMYTRTYKLYLSRPTYLRHSHSPQFLSQLQKASLKSKFTETRLLLGLIFYDTAAVCGNPHVIFSLRFNEHLGFMETQFSVRMIFFIVAVASTRRTASRKAFFARIFLAALLQFRSWWNIMITSVVMGWRACPKRSSRWSESWIVRTLARFPSRDLRGQ